MSGIYKLIHVTSNFRFHPLRIRPCLSTSSSTMMPFIPPPNPNLTTIRPPLSRPTKRYAHIARPSPYQTMHPTPSQNPSTAVPLRRFTPTIEEDTPITLAPLHKIRPYIPPPIPTQHMTSQPTTPAVEQHFTTTMFTVKVHKPFLARDVYITMSRSCNTAHDLCNYLLSSQRARTNLLDFIHNIPEFHGRKTRIHHPIFIKPILLYPQTDDEKFRHRIRRYYSYLPLDERS